MPNIRIKDIPTTASATVNGDFFAVDSNASTRKLDAFAPTFGGGIVVAGGAFAAASFYKSSSLGSVLSGATGTSYDLFLTNPAGSYIMQVPTGTRNVQFAGTLSTVGNTSVGGSATIVGNTEIGGTPLITPVSIDRYLSVNVTALADNPALALSVSDGTKNARGSMYIDASTTQERMAWDFTYSNAQFPALEWRIAGNVHATLRNNGSLILSGTGTDSNNGRLQLATHTASSGGIGFGTDTSLYRAAAGALMLTDGTVTGLFWARTANSALEIGPQSNHSLILRTNNTVALTLDTSQNATFSKDVVLGFNGPSVPSTLSGRAPRQGLVFDGTIGADVSVPAFGTSDFTVAVWARTNNAATPNYITVGNTGVFGSLSLGDGSLYYFKSGGVGNRQVPGVFVSNKFVFVVIAKASGVVRTYVDGVLVDTWTDTNDAGGGYTSAITKIGGLATQWWNGTLVPIIYNRALSAAEVKALYENGVPATEDLGVAGSIAPSNTTLTTSAVAQNFAYDTFSSTTNSFSAVETGGQACEANFISGTTFLGKAPRGARFLVSFTATLTSGATPSVRLSTQAVAGTSSAIVNVVNGSNFIILQLIEPFTAETGTGAGRVTFATGTNTNYSISNLVVTRLGTVLAPDATQTGGGLTWYDTSGNGANITLPANGVSWNVPWAGSLTPSGAATPVLIKKTQAYLEVNSDDLRRGRFGADGSNAVSLGTLTNVPLDFFVNSVAAARFAATSGNLLVNGTNDTNNYKVKVYGSNTSVVEGLGIYNSTPYAAGSPAESRFSLGRLEGSTLQEMGAIGARPASDTSSAHGELLFYTRATGVLSMTGRWTNSGNLLIGPSGTPDSGNGRLQFATHTASAGGIGFGADVTLYRSAADTLRTDDAFQAERVSGDNSASAILGVLNTSGAGVTNSFGIDARVIVNNSSGTTGSAIGLRALSRVSNASNVGAAIALVAQVDNPGAGTIATAYGLYVNPITVGANNYAIFTEGAAPSRFGGNVNLVGDLTVDKTEPTITFKRAANTNLNIINLWTGASADFGIGLRNTSDSDLHIYNYGTANDALKIAKATSAVTLSGNLTVLGTVVDPAITGTILEDIFTITDAAAFEVDPGNGSIQLITLGASRTPKATNFAAGESVTMMIDDGTAFTLTWTDATWGTGGVKWVGGSAPTLATTGYTVIQLWKVGTQVYGARVGDVV